ncbi:hypothetical protein F8M41_019976, partial [Gigaspora margarita]
MLFFLPADFAVGALFTGVIKAAIFRCDFTGISESIRVAIFGCDFIIGAIVTGVIGCIFSFRYDFAIGVIIRIQVQVLELLDAFFPLDMISSLEPLLEFGFG